MHITEIVTEIHDHADNQPAGERKTIGVSAAIANAVFRATGQRVRSLPITLDKLL